MRSSSLLLTHVRHLLSFEIMLMSDPCGPVLESLHLSSLCLSLWFRVPTILGCHLAKPRNISLDICGLAGALIPKLPPHSPMRPPLVPVIHNTNQPFRRSIPAALLISHEKCVLPKIKSNGSMLLLRLQEAKMDVRLSDSRLEGRQYHCIFSKSSWHNIA